MRHVSLALGAALLQAIEQQRRLRPSPEALAQVDELKAQGRYSYVSIDESGLEAVFSYPADHQVSLDYFASERQHPGALTDGQKAAIKAAGRANS